MLPSQQWTKHRTTQLSLTFLKFTEITICNLLEKNKPKNNPNYKPASNKLSIKTIKESYCFHWRELLPSYKTQSFNKVRQQATNVHSQW